MPRPDRARISGPKGPEILVYDIVSRIEANVSLLKCFNDPHTYVIT